MKDLFVNFILLILALFLAVFLFPIGWLHGLFTLRLSMARLSHYFLTIALSIDQLGNVILAPLFNAILITKDGYKFGDEDDTISYALGKNLEMGTLTKLGRFLQITLDKIDKDHCKKAVELAIIKGQKFCNIN